ncbi:helix-turn-helix domain-containing protein [Winogradskyella vincentii]|uniref:Helix-turn-helix domain-containing protein n=1 Tax=Winogradskyella vincentii TaxID=2877122 RepID=A0ABS7Y1T9_9FLAO|nr:helix-turn-helix domain-containing protein [Winogradskyella vincentii]MCA0153910.1 helix-turn-helix domain-containing protein [Winogradskyella vincentii]
MFPDFNRWSLPLLILVLQGLIFVVLLLSRYYRKRNISDLFLGLILLLTCYSQICYTVGFMGWYNEFRTTKINYFLINIGIGLAPLIFLYVKSITTSNFKFKKSYWWHFALAFAVIIYRFAIYTYDAFQPGFDDTQNGILKIELDETYVQSIMSYIEAPFILVYLAFTFQLFYNYRKKIIQYFSNTYKLELNWILSFLILFSLSFLYGVIQDIIGARFIDLGYQQRWWLNLFVALVTLYVGIKGYFTDTTKLNKLDFTFTPKTIGIPEANTDIEVKSISNEDIDTVKTLMENEKAYLNSDLNLSDLAKMAKMSRAQLSETINSGFNKNFNDFVNEYRVNAFKKMLSEEKHKQLSLLGIAEECGFNSKATFNRVFKKITNSSPTEYLKSQST